MTELRTPVAAVRSTRERVLTRVFGVEGRLQRLLVANVLVDAAGSAAYLAALLLFAMVAKGLTAQAITTTLGASGLLAIALTYFAGYLADRFDPRAVLVVLQGAQALIGLLLFQLDGRLWVVVLIGASVVLSRMQSPVRGALPPRFIDSAAIVGFKAAQRSRTIVVAVVFGAIGASIAGLRNAPLIEAVPLINAASYLVCCVLTWRLGALPQAPAADRGTRSNSWGLRARTLITVTAVLVGVAAICGSIAGTVIPLTLGTNEQAPSWLLTELVVVEFAAVLAFQRALRDLVGTDRGRTACLLGVGVALPVSMSLLYAAMHADTTWLMSALLAVAAFLLSGCEVGVLLLSWHWQYTLGAESQRGRIIAIFAVGASVTVSLAAPLGNAILDRSLLVWAGTGSALGLATLLLILVQLRRGQPSAAV